MGILVRPILRDLRLEALTLTLPPVANLTRVSWKTLLEELGDAPAADATPKVKDGL